MLPVKPPDANLVLYLQDDDGNRIADADLHATRALDANGKMLLETHWRPDEGERRALANGAPIVLMVWGKSQPPVRLTAGDPDVAGSGILLGEHVNRALGLLFAWLADYSGATDAADFKSTRVTMITGRTVTPDAFLKLFQECLKETATHSGDGHQVPETADDALDAIDRNPARHDDED